MTRSDAAPFPLGVSFRTLDHGQRLDTIGILAGSSVKTIELWEPTFEKSDCHVQEARRALATAGVEPRSVHANFGSSMDLSSTDSTIRSAGVQAAGVAIDLAVRIGASMVIIHSSSELVDNDVREVRMKQAKRSIETIADMARQNGCRVAVELLPRTCLGRSVEELFALLEGLGTETVGVCMDTNHLMGNFAALPDVVRRLGPRLFTLHCSDYDGIDERHWSPLRGVIDWAAFISALSAIGFSGSINYEAKLDGQTPAERLAFLETNFSQLMSLLA